MSSTKTSTTKAASNKGPKDSAANWGIALFAVICCAALPIALTVGLGGVLSLLASPWVLIPTALAMAGIFTWYLKR